jgi:hypothetical protein
MPDAVNFYELEFQSLPSYTCPPKFQSSDPNIGEIHTANLDFFYLSVKMATFLLNKLTLSLKGLAIQLMATFLLQRRIS